MRKRRAIIYDDDLSILNVFRMFFELRGYDVITCREPVRCPLYEDHAQCTRLHPCGDVILTDHIMPRMTGLELLRAQREQGCRLPARNKAIVSGFLDHEALEEVERMGLTFFQKPVQFDKLDAWLTECEQRMDLSVPLGFKRREPRKADGPDIIYRMETSEELLTAEVLNHSDSGLCIHVMQPPERWQTITLMTMPHVLSRRRYTVRWLTPSQDGGFLVGMSGC